MATRIEFNEALNEICENVYYQPPETLKLKFPCIIYKRNNIDIKYADDINYSTKVAYQVTVIDKSPDSEIIKSVIDTFNYVRFNTHFTQNNLNHDSFTIYY